MKLHEPQDNKRAVFQSIQSYVFVAWFPDLSVAIRIYSLACLYNLKANRNQFSKYFEVYMILKDDCTEQPLFAIEVWSVEVETCNMRLFHPPLRLSIFYGSCDQLRPWSFLHMREEPGNKVEPKTELIDFSYNDVKHGKPIYNQVVVEPTNLIETSFAISLGTSH